MYRLRSVLILLLALALLTPAAAGAQETQSGISLEVRTPFGEFYRPYFWLPLYITAANEGADRMVELQVGQFATQVELPRGARKEVVLYVRPTPQMRFTVVARSGGAEVASARIRLLTTERSLVSIVGQAEVKPRRIEMIPVTPQLLPDRVEGLGALNTVILDGRQRADLTTAQLHALETWIGGGGNLLITAGGSMEALLAALPDQLRPAQAAAGDTATLSAAPLAAFIGQPGDPGTVTALRLTPEDGARITVEGQDGRPLMVSKIIGEGRVAALAISLDAVALTTWEGSDQLWQKLIPAERPLPMWDPSMSIAQLRDQQAPSVLANLPALDLPPLHWLMILLGVYIVLVGPVSYIVLRWLDRLAWAWVTIPALTAIFALLTYGVGASQRGSDLILNQVAIVEQSSNNRARVHGYASIFSPVRATYTLQASDEALVRPLDFAQWGPAPSASTAEFQQSPGRIANLRVNQWSLEMVGYSAGIEWQGLASTLSLEGQQVVGEVTNQSQQTIRDIALVIGGDLHKIGDLEPGQTTAVEVTLNNQMGGTGESLGSRLFAPDWSKFGPNGPPRELQIKMAAADLAVPAPLIMGNMQPLLVGWLDQAPIEALAPVNDQRYSRHQNTLLVSRPRLEFGSGEIVLNGMWLELTTSNFNSRESCSTFQGPGFPLQQRVTQASYTLPAQAAGLSPSSLTLKLQAEGPPFINKLITKARDWETGEFVEIKTGLGQVELEEPRRFIPPNGELQLEIELPVEVEQFGGFWGCFSPGIAITGRLP